MQRYASNECVTQRKKIVYNLARLKVQNWPRKSNRTCSNMTQAAQEVLNGITVIYHMKSGGEFDDVS